MIVQGGPNTFFEEGIMETNSFKTLKDQIWTTRVSRINAEKRLVTKENFVQGINIYYSCITIIFSVLSLINKDNKLSTLTMFMTISLFIVILYLNGQKYTTRARDFRKNYTQLHKLETQLQHITANEDIKIMEIEKDYCDLLDSNENHIDYDYYCTVHGSTGDYKEKRWKQVKCKFFWGTMWRICVKFIIIVLPFILLLICEVC